MKLRSFNPHSPELTVYYDKRYNQFFFAGAHHPKRDAASIPKVEVVSHETTPDRPPILVTPYDQRKRRSKSTRVKWAEGVQSNSQKRRWDNFVSVAVCAALFCASGVGLIIIGPLMLFDNEPTSESEDYETTFAMRDSMSSYLPPLKRERWTTVDTEHYESTPEPFAASARAGKLSYNGEAAQHTAELVAGQATGKKTVVNVCLFDDAGDAAEESFWDGGRASSCGIVVECRYSIDKEDMRLQPSAQSFVRNHSHQFREAEQGAGGASSVSVLLCVSIDNEVLQDLAADNAGQLNKLVRNVVLAAAAYDGICLRWSAEPTQGRGSFLDTIRTIADGLSEGNYTLSLLLPYGLPSKDLQRKITRLVEALGRPHALLLYPTAALFRKKAKWPSPKDIAFLPPRTSAKVCYLLPASAHAVALQGTCDVRKAQRIENVHALKTVSDGCRLWNRSWMAVSDAYYTYACYGNAGILFQKSEQARTFRDDIVRYTHATCLGASGAEFDSFPATCEAIND